MELWCRQMKYHLVPWNSMELWDCHFMTCYPGLPRNIPRNSTEFWNRQIKITKKSPWSMGFHGIFHRISWNSMELWCCQMKYQLVPWNSMEYSMEFHGTLVPPNDISLSSMEFHGTFHGIPWHFGAAKWSITEFHGIPWNFEIVILWPVTLDFQGIFQGIPRNSGIAN